MSLLGNMVKAVKRTVGVDKEYNTLIKWAQKHEQAYAKLNKQLYDEREMIYAGTKEIDADPNVGVRKSRKKARNVRNVSYEMIESQVDTSMPHPSVHSKRKGFQFAAKMVAESLKSDIAELPLHRINDENERITPVQGLSIVQVMWNNDYRNHLYRGELDLLNLHPKQFIPQPGIWDVQEMDYFFIMTSRTKEYIKKRYGKALGQTSEEYPEINQIDYEVSSTHSGHELDEKVTEIICWYKDEDDDVCKFVWAGEEVLEDLPKFYHRRVAICQQCGAKNAQKDEACSECGHKKLKVNVETHETIEEDLYLEPIIYDKVVKQVIRDEFGRPVEVQEGSQKVIQERIVPAGTQVPYYNPSRYPVVVRINTPQSFRFGGQSDIDIIRDQQNAIKKLMTKIEDKIFSSGSIIKKPRRVKVDITNEEYQVLEGEIADLNNIGVVTLQAETRQDLEFIVHQYDSLKAVLGINDSWQGKYDPSAKSGKAKELQIQQAAGRLASKILNKQDFFKHLYEIMFEFKLAFYDELRPYLTKNDLGEDDWGDFNKYEFLVQDTAGEWYYNTDFIFAADAGYGLPTDKLWLYEQIGGQVGAGLIDIIQYWTILQELHFPMASMILSQVKRKQEMMAEQEQAMANQQANANAAATGTQSIDAMLSQLDPAYRPNIEKLLIDLTPEQQQNLVRLQPDEMVNYIMQLSQSKEGGGMHG